MRGHEQRLVGGLGDLARRPRSRPRSRRRRGRGPRRRWRAPSRAPGCRWRRRPPACSRRAARSGRASSRRPRRRRSGCRRSPSASARPRGRPAGRCCARGRGRSAGRGGCGRSPARGSSTARIVSWIWCGRCLSSAISSAIALGRPASPRSCASQSPSRYIAATWLMKVLVAATPISSPARVSRTASASRVAWLPMTLVTASTRRAALAREPHRRQRVGGLARLGDPDHQVVGADHRVAVAVLGGDVHLDRDPRPLLDRVATDEAGVVGGAAGDDHDPARCAGDEVRRRARARRGRRASSVGEPVGDRLGDRVGLLVDLLQHEGLVAALLGRLLVPGDLLDLALDRRARRRR